MKVSEIEVGKTYTNGKGRSRRVLRFENFITSKPQEESPTAVQATAFDVVYVHETPGAWKGRIGKMWLPYFASWAKAEVKEG